MTGEGGADLYEARFARTGGALIRRFFFDALHFDLPRRLRSAKLGEVQPAAAYGDGEKAQVNHTVACFDQKLEKIDAALSITPLTFRKNYFRELNVNARSKMHRRVGAIIHRAAPAEGRAGKPFDVWDQA